MIRVPIYPDEESIRPSVAFQVRNEGSRIFYEMVEYTYGPGNEVTTREVELFDQDVEELKTVIQGLRGLLKVATACSFLERDPETEIGVSLETGIDPDFVIDNESGPDPDGL